MDIEYWEDVSEYKTLEPEIIFMETLIEPTIDSQVEDIQQDPLSINVAEYAKNLVNFKEGRKTRSLKENEESITCIKQSEMWKVNVKRDVRLKGDEYIKVEVPDTKMGPPCACRLHCTDRIDEKDREELNKVFWNSFTWQQRKQYIALSVKEYVKQRTRLSEDKSKASRRQMSYTYFLLLKGEYITVCKAMFVSTFAVSTKFVQEVIEKSRMSHGFISPDQRGKYTPKIKKSEGVKDRVREHIRSFPTKKSTDPKDRSGREYLDANLSIITMYRSYILKCRQERVPESDIVRESYYRRIFKMEFNLGFNRAQIKEN